MEAFLAIAREHRFGRILAHAPYALDGGSADPAREIALPRPFRHP